MAQAAELDGAWVAWLSDSQTRAIDRVQDSGPWYRVDRQTLVFNNRASLMVTPLAAVGTDERGNPLVGEAWTGTSPGGRTAANNCVDWTSGSTFDEGQDGRVHADGTAWTEFDQLDCDLPAHLYCIEQ